MRGSDVNALRVKFFAACQAELGGMLVRNKDMIVESFRAVLRGSEGRH